MSKIPVILLVAILVSGCSSIKKTTKTLYNGEPGEINFDKVKELNITNTGFIIQKAVIEININGEKEKFNFSLKHNEEGSYLLSIRSKSGIEAARIFLSEDTILMNDRMSRKLYYGSSDYLNYKYGIPLSAIPVLFGDYLGKDSIASVLNCKNGVIGTKDIIKSKSISYTLDCRLKKVKSIRLADETETEIINISYNRFETREDYLFPQQIEVEDSFRNSVFRISIEKIEFSGGESVFFIPGKDYEKVLLK